MVAAARPVSDRPRIDLIPAQGGPGSTLCDDCAPGDWSPDGARLVVQRGNPTRLLLRDISSGREIEMAAHPTWNLLQPRFSPDGRWIVFHTTNSPSLRQIYAVPVVSEGPVPVDAWIPIVRDFGVQPSWASDGSAIYYFSSRDGALCAWRQPLDPGTKRPVGSPQAVQHFHQSRLRAPFAAGAQASNHVAAGYLYVTLAASAANIWMLVFAERKLLLVNGLRIGRSTPAASTNRPQRSTGVHGHPWASSRSASKHSANRLAPAVRGAAPLACPNRPPSTKAWGYFWGYVPIWGYRYPGGIGARDQHDPGLTVIHAREGPRLLVELARTRIPYKRAAAEA